MPVGRLPRITGQELLRFLEREGFRVIRVRGSHHFLESTTHRTCIPIHSGRTLKTGTLRSILRDIELLPSEFERKLRDG